MVKQKKITRVNIDILVISKIKWTGTGEFNSADHYIYYCGQESLIRNAVALIVNKSLKCSTWVNLKSNRMILVNFQGKPFNITIIQVYIPTTDAEEVKVGQFYEDL